MKLFFRTMIAAVIITLGAAITSCQKSPYDNAVSKLDDLVEQINNCTSVEELEALGEKLSDYDDLFKGDFTPEQITQLQQKAMSVIMAIGTKAQQLGVDLSGDVRDLEFDLDHNDVFEATDLEIDDDVFDYDDDDDDDDDDEF